MKKRGLPILTAILAFLFAITSGCTAAQEGEDLSADPAWSADYDAALLKAKENGKRTLVYFTGSDWCHWCVRMGEETFSQQAFKDYAAEHLVLVYIDMPMKKKLPADVAARNDSLRRQYGVNGFPSFVVLDPDGNEVDRRSGYVPGGPTNFIYFLNVTAGTEKPSK